MKDIILKELIEKNDSQIILIFSRGSAEDLVIDVFTKGNLILSDMDKMMLKNTNLSHLILNEENTKKGQN